MVFVKVFTPVTYWFTLIVIVTVCEVIEPADKSQLQLMADQLFPATDVTVTPITTMRPLEPKIT
jgi:hypothetical protein